MDFLLDALTKWLKEMLVGGIMSNLSGLFDSVNQQVADISVQVRSSRPSMKQWAVWDLRPEIFWSRLWVWAISSVCCRRK